MKLESVSSTLASSSAKIQKTNLRDWNFCKKTETLVSALTLYFLQTSTSAHFASPSSSSVAGGSVLDSTWQLNRLKGLQRAHKTSRKRSPSSEMFYVCICKNSLWLLWFLFFFCTFQLPFRKATIVQKRCCLHHQWADDHPCIRWFILCCPAPNLPPLGIVRFVFLSSWVERRRAVHLRDSGTKDDVETVGLLDYQLSRGNNFTCDAHAHTLVVSGFPLRLRPKVIDMFFFSNTRELLYDSRLPCIKQNNNVT